MHFARRDKVDTRRPFRRPYIIVRQRVRVMRRERRWIAERAIIVRQALRRTALEGRN